MAGVDGGFLASALGERARLEPSVFNAGPAIVEALFGGSLDAAFLGPTPALNAFVRSRGEAVRVVAGATSGGASLVVRPGIAGPRDLRGATLATPQLGNTQDVALRRWLGEQELSVDPGDGSGDVAVAPVDSATALHLLRQGRLDGAWVPEPWASRMVAEAGAVRLLDERDLWPGGAFPTTVLVVSLPFARAHPEVVERLVQGHVAATVWLQEDPARAAAAVADGLEALVGTRLPDHVVAEAWSRLTPTVDPLATALQATADHAAALGFGEPVDLAGALDLTALDRVLTARGLPASPTDRRSRRAATWEPTP